MKLAIFWMRRDLRLEDNAGLYEALKWAKDKGGKVLPLFIFDTEILDKLQDRKDPRLQFIHDQIGRLKAQLETMGSSLMVRQGNPTEVWPKILKEFQPEAVFANRDYEPYAMERDKAVADYLASQACSYFEFKDHVLLDASEVHKDDGKPYTVFTPYSKKWRAKIASKSKLHETDSYFLKSYPNSKYFQHFAQTAALTMPSLAELGFEASSIAIPEMQYSEKMIREYHEKRDYPAIEGTTRLGIHLRFGTISIRQLARDTWHLNATFINELIWRDFYSMILQNFPHVVNGPFRPEYERVQWSNNMAHFEAWKEGKTGYPIVDAGMRELAATGHMHNRLRMITASFLSKHLLLDWRWGEAWFAEKLLDFDLASNNGGWQWAAGCGTDAAPYFRIFNPDAQQQKFDSKKAYIRKWVPEYGTAAYPQPIVDHKASRERCLAAYKRALKPEEANSQLNLL